MSMSNAGTRPESIAEAVTAARWQYRLERMAWNKYAIFRDGVRITDPAPAAEAGVDLAEAVAVAALEALGIDRAAELVERVLDAGCDVRADWITGRAAVLAGYHRAPKPRARGKAAVKAGGND